MEEVFKWAVYVITGLLAWVGNDMRREINANKQEFSDYKLHVSEYYLKKEELKEMMQPILRKLDKIEDYLIHNHDTKIRDNNNG